MPPRVGKSVYNDYFVDELSKVGSGADSGVMSTGFDRAPLIETAEITRVDPVLWVVDVTTKNTGRTCRNIEIGGGMVNRGGGFSGSMPEIGDKCVIAHLSDETIPKIIAFIPYLDQSTGARGQRLKMLPGDSIMSANSGNYVHVHAGGVVDIAANPITRRTYVPVLNQIKDFCENYYLTSAGGQMRWENRRDDKDEEGSEVELVWEVKEYNEGPTLLTLRRGKVSDPGSGDYIDSSAVIEDKALVVDDEFMYRCTLDRGGNLAEIMTTRQESILGDHLSAVQGAWTKQVDGTAYVNSSDVQLGQSPVESAVLGNTLNNLLKVYGQLLDTYLQNLQAVLTAVGLGMQGNAGIETAAAIAGKALEEAVKNALDPLAKQIKAHPAQFQLFLAKNTKLS